MTLSPLSRDAPRLAGSGRSVRTVAAGARPRRRATDTPHLRRAFVMREFSEFENLASERGPLSRGAARGFPASPHGPRALPREGGTDQTLAVSERRSKRWRTSSSSERKCRSGRFLNRLRQ